ncbi:MULTISPECIES: hypothetical protein [Candidatus Ichthyocystis]|nr:MULTISPECIES: hypothetical protein [Ichthyocystis]
MCHVEHLPDFIRTLATTDIQVLSSFSDRMLVPLTGSGLLNFL